MKYNSLSSRAVVDQHTRPQVHASLHGLVTPPRVRWSSFQSASQYSPCSLVEDGRVLLCRELADIVHRCWHVESVCFGACDQGSVVVDHVLCVWAHSWRLMWGLSYYALYLNVTCYGALEIVGVIIIIINSCHDAVCTRRTGVDELVHLSAGWPWLRPVEHYWQNKTVK